MGNAAEAGFEQVPLSRDQVNSYNGTATSASHSSQQPLDQYPAPINTRDGHLHHETSSLEQSPIFYHQSSQSMSESNTVTGNRFAIPTKNNSLSSGFPFHPRLYNLKVTHDEWHLFSSDIVEGAKMTLTEDYLAWTTGITAGTLTSPFLLVFAPVVGYYSGRAVHRKAQVKTVKEKLLQEGDLRSILRRWNEQKFMQKGFQAWLELPRDPGELHKDNEETTLEAKRPKDQKKIAKKAAKRFRIIIIPNEEDDEVSTVFQSSRSVASSSNQAPVELSTDEPRQSLPAPDTSTMPPAYSDSNNDEMVSPVSQPGGIQKPDIPEQDSDTIPPPHVQYGRPGGFTNT